MSAKLLMLYMPVLHAGYLQLFDEVRPQTIALITEELLRDLPDGLAYIAKKDIIRALPSDKMMSAVQALFPSEDVTVIRVTKANIFDLGTSSEAEIVLPHEDVSYVIAETFLDPYKVRFVVPPAPRLRYHRNNVEEQKLLVPGRRLALSALDREMVALATSVAERSPDWYRQVGGSLHLKDGRSIVAFNEHQPHEQLAATFGDPRSLFKSGVRTDLSFGDHTEHVLFGEAARRGISTEGAYMYITDFPCLPCSRLSVRGGVAKIFYAKPSYGLLDADQYLRLKKVELIEVFDDI